MTARPCIAPVGTPPPGWTHCPIMWKLPTAGSVFLILIRMDSVVINHPSNEACQLPV